MNEDFIKLCYEWFKETDTKFPKDLTLDDYKKYAEECNKILKTNDLIIISKYEDDVKSEE